MLLNCLVIRGVPLNKRNTLCMKFAKAIIRFIKMLPLCGRFRSGARLLPMMPQFLQLCFDPRANQWCQSARKQRSVTAGWKLCGSTFPEGCSSCGVCRTVRSEPRSHCILRRLLAGGSCEPVAKPARYTRQSSSSRRPKNRRIDPCLPAGIR